MPFYRCPSCGLTLQSVARRFRARACLKCSVPLLRTDEIHVEEHRPAAVTRCFPAEPRAAHAARGALEALLWDLDPEEFEIAALLITELIANSVDHAGTGKRGSVRLDVALTTALVRAEVRDDGPGFVPTPRTEDSPLESHWGLHLMDQLADRWAVMASPESLVWFELDRPRARRGVRKKARTARASSAD
jgi:anti-sigma regulatory factor (Ser/Thr protein kinase)